MKEIKSFRLAPEEIQALEKLSETYKTNASVLVGVGIRMLADIQSGAALLGVLTGENQNFLADFRKVNPKVSDDEIVNTALLRFLLDPLRRYIAAYEQPIISSSVDEYAGSSEMTFGDD